MADEPYTKREIDILIKGQNDNFDRLFKRMDNQDAVLANIQEGYNSNQREIDHINDTIKDYPEMKLVVATLVNYKWWLIGAVAAFAVLGSSVVLLFEARIDNKITMGIESAVIQHFQKVQVINNN